jgi:arylformamidase
MIQTEERQVPRHHQSRILDLTKPIDAAIEIYTEQGYSDPPYECTEWCSVESKGYRVSALRLGTQTGTHIDAPAHFDSQGATLEALPVERLIGRYFLLDLPACAGAETVGGLCRSFAQQEILFVRAPQGGKAKLSPAALDLLLSLSPQVWVIDGGIEVEGAPEFQFHRLIARAGKYLVEDLDHKAAQAVRPGGEIAALPLALVGTSGAPCRVIVREVAESG